MIFFHLQSKFTVIDEYYILRWLFIEEKQKSLNGLWIHRENAEQTKLQHFPRPKEFELTQVNCLIWFNLCSLVERKKKKQKPKNKPILASFKYMRMLIILKEFFA